MKDNTDQVEKRSKGFECGVKTGSGTRCPISDCLQSLKTCLIPQFGGIRARKVSSTGLHNVSWYTQPNDFATTEAQNWTMFPRPARSIVCHKRAAILGVQPTRGRTPGRVSKTRSLPLSNFPGSVHATNTFSRIDGALWSFDRF